MVVMKLSKLKNLNKPNKHKKIKVRCNLWHFIVPNDFNTYFNLLPVHFK